MELQTNPDSSWEPPCSTPHHYPPHTHIPGLNHQPRSSPSTHSPLLPSLPFLSTIGPMSLSLFIPKFLPRLKANSQPPCLELASPELLRSDMDVCSSPSPPALAVPKHHRTFPVPVLSAFTRKCRAGLKRRPATQAGLPRAWHHLSDSWAHFKFLYISQTGKNFCKSYLKR